MDLNKTEIALVGAGVIGRRHLEALRSVEDVQLVGIADHDRTARAQFETESVPTFDRAEDLLDQLEPDGVIVATPTEHHLKPTLAALDRGIHVLVEKPIMATIEQARQTVEKEAASKGRVLVGHHRRYYGLVDKAREIIASGRIGEIVAVCGQWNVRKHAEYYEPDWRKRWQAGPILTNLIHDMDLLRHIVGDVTSVMAETSSSVLGHGKEDTAALVLRFSNDALGTFILSDQSHSPWSFEQASGENPFFPRTGQNMLHIMGTEGSLEFPNLKLWRTPGGTTEWRSGLQAEDLSAPIEDAFVRQIEHFANVIRGRVDPLISTRDATDTLCATLAVYEAAKSGRRVVL